MPSSIKKWTAEEIRFNMETNNKWLIRGLLAIYSCQTADERNDGITKHDNGIGFNGVDSSFLSNMAIFYNKAGYLSPKQLEKTRQRMLKYSKQLATIAAEKTHERH